MDNDSATSWVYASARSPWFEPRHEEPNPIREMLAAIEGADETTRRQFIEAIRDHGLKMSANAPDPAELGIEVRKWPHQGVMHDQPKPPPTSLVYYVKFADRVKIGFTTNLVNRLQAIPHDEVLATEPGPMDLERARHQQFSDLRVVGEWFRYEEPLVSHIKSLKAA